MKQFTLRVSDDEIAKRLQQITDERHTSLNKATLRLLRQATGLDYATASPNRVGEALDSFNGTWTEDEERSFNQATNVFVELDAEFWS